MILLPLKIQPPEERHERRGPLEEAFGQLIAKRGCAEGVW
jgi:hypothetical protein